MLVLNTVIDHALHFRVALIGHFLLGDCRLYPTNGIGGAKTGCLHPFHNVLEHALYLAHHRGGEYAPPRP